MNIFYSDENPRQCAENLDDKRLVKMVLETAQLLSTAMYELGSTNLAPYKPTHKNHPCSIWVRSSKSAFAWTLMHFEYLADEYKYRYEREHASYTKCFDDFAHFYFDATSIELFGDEDVASKIPPNCTPYKQAQTLHAYRFYLVNDKWSDKSKWTKRERPYWHDDYLIGNWDITDGATL